MDHAHFIKSILKVLPVVGALVIPVIPFAQTAAPVTRAEVRAQLVELESVGYRPASRDLYYPAAIQAAEARVAQVNSAGDSSTAGVGGTTEPTSQSGSGRSSIGAVPVFRGH
jgi:hypothetical protein